MSNSLVELRRRYAALETDELFAIVHTDSDQYRPEAVRVAKEELARRKVSNEDAAELQQKAETKRRERLDEEEKPLSAGLKLLCLLLAGMPALVTYAIMESKGRKRAAREALLWAGASIAMWFVLGFLYAYLQVTGLYVSGIRPYGIWRYGHIERSGRLGITYVHIAGAMSPVIAGVVAGVFGTLAMDLLNNLVARTGMFLKIDVGMIGRMAVGWTRGRFRYGHPGEMEQVAGEILYGYVTHYAIGVGLAVLYVLGWDVFIGRPASPVWALVYGGATTAASYFFVYPSMGLGMFGRRSPEGIRAILSPLANHFFYGVGLAVAVASM